MACTNDKFVINKDSINEFIITIKQNDSTLPMVIEPSDTFELKLVELKSNNKIADITMTDNPSVGVISVYDAANGQILVKMYDELVDTLNVERGDRADGYYNKATYRLAIDCSTANNGNFVAKVNKVYVG